MEMVGLGRMSVEGGLAQGGGADGAVVWVGWIGYTGCYGWILRECARYGGDGGIWKPGVVERGLEG